MTKRLTIASAGNDADAKPADRTVLFAAGGYSYLPNVFQYSAGVIAAAGYDIMRVRFRRPLPLAEGFAQIERVVSSEGRPLTSLCACELLSPTPFADDDFRTFNHLYVGTLKEWGICSGDTNPVARTTACPLVDPPSAPSFHAFAFTVERQGSWPSFIIAGSGESVDGKENYRDYTVRLGDVSLEGMREKARYVLGEMERRLAILGFGWQDTTAVQAYTIHNLHPFLADEIVRRGAARSGLTWHFSRPPIVDLEYEMDCRGVSREVVL